MASNRDVVINIGAQVSKDFNKSLNQVGASFNRLGKRVSSQYKSYANAGKAVQDYNTKLNKTGRTLYNLRKDLEKMKKTGPTDLGLDIDLQKITSKINKLKDRREELLNNFYESDLLKGTNFKELTKELNTKKEARADAQSNVSKAQADVDAGKGKSGITKLRQELKVAKQELKKAEKDYKSFLKTIETKIDPNSALSKQLKLTDADIKINKLNKEFLKTQAQDKYNEKLRKTVDSIYDIEVAQRKLENNVVDSTNKMEESVRNVASSVVNFSIQSLSTALNKVANTLIKIGKLTVKALGRLSGIFSDTTSNAISLQKAVRLLVQYGFGFRSLYYLVRRFRSAIKEGFGYLGQASEEVKNSINQLSQTFYFLKSAAASALQPFLNVIMPKLSKLIVLFNRASMAIANFIATFTGQATIYKASENLEDYANALDETAGSAKEAKKQLAGFDDIDVLNGDDNSSGGSSGIDTAGWFTQVPVEASRLAELIKEGWASADFTEVGEFMGQKLSEALANIKWEQFKDKIQKLAKSLTTFIQGFISVDGLSENIGKSLAEVFNSVSTFILNFYQGLFSKDNAGKINIATFTTELIDSFLTTLNTADYGNALHSLVSGVADSIIQTLDDVNWTELGNKIGDFLKNLDIPDLAGKLKNLAIKFAEAFSEALQGWAQTDPESFGIAKALLIVIASTKFTSALIKGLASTLSQAFIKLVSEQGLIGAISSLFSSLTSSFAYSGLPIFEQIGTSISTLGEVASTLNPIVAIIVVLIAAFTSAIAKSEEFRASLVDLASNLLGLLKSLYLNVVKPLFDLLVAVGKPIIDGIISMLADVGLAVFPPIINFINMLIRICKDYLYPVIGSLIELLSALWSYIAPIIDFLLNVIGQALNVIIDILGGVINALTPIAEFLLEILLGAIKTVVDTITKVIKSVSEKWNNFWEDLKETTKNFVNMIIGFINSLVSALVAAINTAIRAINALAIDIPDWVPIVGGNKLGFNLKEIVAPQIPYLAQGAVIPPNREFLAVLGDQKSGTNIETPLSTMVDAFKQALVESGYGGGQELVLNIDGNELARMTVPNNLKELGRRGYNIKVLNKNSI